MLDLAMFTTFAYETDSPGSISFGNLIEAVALGFDGDQRVADVRRHVFRRHKQVGGR